MVSPQTAMSPFAGILFGAGLAVSGMADPSRVRGFLDIGGAFDPTLAFVMVGALIPMAIAWRIRSRLERPLAADAFDVPHSILLDARLVAGAAMFGVGWGITGLCPGPAIVGLAVVPAKAAIFVAAMLAGMALYRFSMCKTV